jgi:cholest-4-en-3-one 26-monooxygenase
VTLQDIDVFDPDGYVPAVPHDAFRILRSDAPVFWHPEPAGPGFWAVTRHRDVFGVSTDPRTFSSGRRGALLVDPNEQGLQTMQLMLLNMDPPKHTKLRNLVSKGFTPRMIARLGENVRTVTTGLIDKIAPRGACDFVAEVAAELPLQVIAEMIGIPQEDRHKVFDWSNRMIGFDDPEYRTSYDDGIVAATEMYAYANELAVERRRNPTDDLVSVLMAAEIDGERLTELEFDVFFLLLSVAGNETTRNLLSGGLLALIEHPEERAKLLAEPSRIPSGVEELLRWVSPVMHVRRTATRDTEIRGTKIREGDKVVVYYISANRDEEVFADPYRFDVDRRPNEHLAFGVGTHFCLGASLARLEIRALFEELLRRLPDIELAAPPRRLRSNFINGIKEMQIRYTPARARHGGNGPIPTGAPV